MRGDRPTEGGANEQERGEEEKELKEIVGVKEGGRAEIADELRATTFFGERSDDDDNSMHTHLSAPAIGKWAEEECVYLWPRTRVDHSLTLSS